MKELNLTFEEHVDKFKVSYKSPKDTSFILSGNQPNHYKTTLQPLPPKHGNKVKNAGLAEDFTTLGDAATSLRSCALMSG